MDQKPQLEKPLRDGDEKDTLQGAGSSPSGLRRGTTGWVVKARKEQAACWGRGVQGADMDGGAQTGATCGRGGCVGTGPYTSSPPQHRIGLCSRAALMDTDVPEPTFQLCSSHHRAVPLGPPGAIKMLPWGRSGPASLCGLFLTSRLPELQPSGWAEALGRHLHGEHSQGEAGPWDPRTCSRARAPQASAPPPARWGRSSPARG